MSDTNARRGMLLQTLRLQYPMALARPSLEKSMEVWYSDFVAEMPADVAYLEEIGAIQVTRTRVLDHQVVMYRLTARGMQLVSKAVTDPLVEIA